MWKVEPFFGLFTVGGREGPLEVGSVEEDLPRHVEGLNSIPPGYLLLRLLLLGG